MLNILSVLQRRGGSDKDKETGKERINISYRIFLQEKNSKNTKSYVQGLL
jgi:hypothetical protein